jgi:hypothetical protein
LVATQTPAVWSELQWQGVKRRLFTILSALSLLLFVAVCVLWARSYWFRYALSYYTPPPPSTTLTTFMVEWNYGSIGIQYEVGEREKQSVMELLLYGLFSPLIMTESESHWWDFGAPLGWACRWAQLGQGSGKPSWAPEPFGFWRRLGFEVRHERVPVNDTFRKRWFLAMPAWASCAPFTLLPSLWLFRQIRRRRRTDLHMCPQCGYDLRATPERCPECGEVTRRRDGSASGGPRGSAG